MLIYTFALPTYSSHVAKDEKRLSMRGGRALDKIYSKLNKKQYGFVKGASKSTETALHKIVHKI